MREWPDCSNTTISSPSVVPISTASMSARGIITSSTRTSRNRRMLWSIARSPGENDSASVVGFGQRVGDFLAQVRAVARLEQAGQPLEEGRPVGRSLGRRSRRGLELGPSSVVSEAALAPPASGFAAGSGMSFIVVRSVSISVTRRDREWQASPSAAPLDRFHRLGLRVVLVVMAEKMQHAMDNEMRRYGAPAACLPVPPRARTVSAASTISPSIGGSVPPISTRKCRKRQHIGRLVLAAPFGVQRPDMGVVGENTTLSSEAPSPARIRLGKRAADRLRDQRLELRLGRPVAGLDQDIDVDLGRLSDGIVKTAATTGRPSILARSETTRHLGVAVIGPDDLGDERMAHHVGVVEAHGHRCRRRRRGCAAPRPGPTWCSAAGRSASDRR